MVDSLLLQAKLKSPDSEARRATIQEMYNLVPKDLLQTYANLTKVHAQKYFLSHDCK